MVFVGAVREPPLFSIVPEEAKSTRRNLCINDIMSLAKTYTKI